jgi:uncharacterized protein (TIGR04206 family)
MKCIQCGTNNSRRDRTNHQGRCKNCRHLFAFDHTSESNYKLRKVTDSFFAKAISDLSAKNTLYFTSKQLFYFLEQRLGGKPTTLSQFIRSFTFKPTSTPKSSVAARFLTICLILSVFWGIGIALYFLCCLQAVRDSQNSAKDRRFYARFLQFFGVLISGIGILFSLHISPLGATTLIVFILSLAVGILIIYYAARQLPEIARQELEEHEERERLERQDREQRQRLERQEQEERERFAKLPPHLKLAPRALILTSTQVDNWLRRWTQINGSIAKLLPATPKDSGKVEVNFEISAYSFDRVVVCDSAAIAQVLIANQFPFEHNSAVLSITGYPQRIFSTVLDMLRRNQELKVYALHDASPHGVSLVHRLRTSPTWFQNSNVTIYDLGILPRQISDNSNLFVRKSVEFANQAKQMPTEVKQSLLSNEVAWLELGYFVELESLSPQRLLQVVTQGIAKSRAPNSTDNVVAVNRGNSDIYILEFEDCG